MSTTVKAWLHSIAAAAIGGAAGALSLIVLTPASVTWNEAGAILLGKAALIGAVIPVLALLKQSPLPGDTDTAKPPVDGANTLNLSK
jgi:hypothetical protein